MNDKTSLFSNKYIDQNVFYKRKQSIEINKADVNNTVISDKHFYDKSS